MHGTSPTSTRRRASDCRTSAEPGFGSFADGKGRDMVRHRQTASTSEATSRSRVFRVEFSAKKQGSSGDGFLRSSRERQPAFGGI